MLLSPFTLGGYCYLVDCTSSVTTNTALLANNINSAFMEVSQEREVLVENYKTYWTLLKKSNELEEKIIKAKSLNYLSLQELKSVKEQILQERLNKNEL
jgi:hypothetical protein